MNTVKGSSKNLPKYFSDTRKSGEIIYPSFVNSKNNTQRLSPNNSGIDLNRKKDFSYIQNNTRPLSPSKHKLKTDINEDSDDEDYL